MARNKYPEETKNLIIDTASKLFIENGYEHTSIQDIIEHSGRIEQRRNLSSFQIERGDYDGSGRKVVFEF